MTRTWMTLLAIAGGLSPAMFGQQYPQPYAPGQNDPGVNRNAPYNDGQYTSDPNYPAYDGSQPYDDVQGDYAPAPPPVPNYAYQRPPMPGAGYLWVDGYWNFLGGRYSWVGGYWMRPPYAGGYWVAPRYTSGRFFRGHWAAPRRDSGHAFRYSQPSYRAPAWHGSSFANHGRDSRPAQRGQHERRR